MSNLITFLVKLSPCSSFFFGKGNGEIGELGNAKNYFSRSNHYPTQTAALGLVRHQLLLQKGLLNIGDKRIAESNVENANKLIGTKSFNTKINEQKFGAIENISPVFLLKGGEHFFLVENTYAIQSNYDFASSKLIEGKGVSSFKNFSDEYKTVSSSIQEFDPKNGFHAMIGSKSEPSSYVLETLDHPKYTNLSPVFTEVEQVGITKGEDGKTEDEAYYKQVNYTLNEDFSFAFYVTLNLYVNLKSTFVTWGGNQKPFKMEVIAKDIPNWYDVVPNSNNASSKVLLLSDALVGSDYLKYCITAIGTKSELRNLETDTNSNNYDNKANFNTALSTLKRGTVLWLKQDAKIAFLDKPALQKIGYNFYTRII